jgi:serine/threonine protein phosphatase 1
MPAAARSMFHRLLTPSAAPAPTVCARAPEGKTLYVVGDIHGRSDMLRILLRKIALHALSHESRGSEREDCELILLGDYIDRGPDSRGVIDMILSVQDQRVFSSVTALKGNHEQGLLTFLENAAFWPLWAEHGARETLLSYGVSPPARGSDAEAWERARGALIAALPAEHRAFLDGLQLCAQRGDYMCVHAGVRPDQPLDEQAEQDMLWIREDFLKSQRRLDKVIVHGHTPASEAYVGDHRIGLDTGAYATSVLTAIRLCGEERTVIQARGKD